MRFAVRALLVLWLSSSAVLAAEFDDCDANFIAFLGSSAYQFSPAHEGELGTVRLYAILSYQRAAHEKRFGFALWQLRIERADDATRVMTLDGRGYIGHDGATIAELYWDGRDDYGRLVPAGKYRYTFVARYLPDLPGRFRPVPGSYDAVFEGFSEAVASSDEVIVNYDLPQAAAQRLRVTTHATSCQLHQNAPMEAGFGYNFYYGSTHAHSNWSDGGHPTSNCDSGNSYGSGTFAPADVFNFARTEAGLDYWLVNEHNHLIQDAINTNNPPVTEAKVRQRYQDGIAAANAATVNGDFVGLYGMEWGVTTNDDQGHVTLIETPVLLGWESCTTCNGPSAECTPGTNCYFDVFTPKRFGYLTLYAQSVANPSSAGALGVFNHPGSGNFDNFAFNANADNAMQGIAVRSGLAFSTATDCATANIASSDYSARWRQALNLGFHLAPTADHDSHCNNYGVALPTRTVYLAPSLTKANLLAAHRARHFFASEDPNVQLVFRTSDGSKIMGDIFNSPGGATLVANVYDPDGESVLTLEIWRGTIGGGAPSTPYATYSNQSSVTLNETLTSGTYWYYVRAIQADGHDVWSAPMWITYQAGGGGGGSSVDVSGWKVTQANAAGTYTIPAGTVIPAEGYLVIGRDATKAAFEVFRGVTLGANVVYLNSAGLMPVINGDENFTLQNASNVTVDGPSASQPAGALKSIQRVDPCGATWNTLADTASTPGTGAGTGCAGGVKLNEHADASGTGNFIYEFVELHNDSAAGGGDTTAPTTSITAPANGATVSATVNVTASASDNVGVTKVEFWLDGALQSTDTSSPYAWSWNTTTATNGAHALVSKAYDAANNIGTSSTVNVTVSNGISVDVSGWRIVQANATLTYFIPAGTIIPSKGYLVVGRNATKAQFESFWGVTLGANVIYINSADTMPQINGSETYDLRNAANTRVDGLTVAMGNSGNERLNRTNGCGSPSSSSSWSRLVWSTANPGTGAPAPCNKGAYISEFSDAAGTGNFVYEFVEIHNDK